MVCNESNLCRGPIEKMSNPLIQNSHERAADRRSGPESTREKKKKYTKSKVPTLKSSIGNRIESVIKLMY